MGKKEAAMDGTPRIIDLDAEVAKLRMFRRSPGSTAADRKGSVVQLASYRDGLLLALKSSGKDHWERHLTGDELIHILDGAVSLEIVCDNGPPKSFELRTGTVAVIPQGAWHRFLSSEARHKSRSRPFRARTSRSMWTTRVRSRANRQQRGPFPPSSISTANSRS